MPEIETQDQKTRAEIASYLRDTADQLEAGGPLTLELGGQSTTLHPAEPITLKMEGEWGEGGAGREESVEFELVWQREAGSGADAGEVTEAEQP